MNDICHFLPWDSEFFNLRIAKVVPNRLSHVSILLINKWCKENSIDCIYFLADPEFSVTTRIVEIDQYRLVDVRIIMHHENNSFHEPNQPNANYQVRPYRNSDLPSLRDISRNIFTRSRFYSDPCFPKDKCDELYDVWIKNSCEGYADHVLVAEIKGLPQGFITCHVRQNRLEGDIGLVGVSEQARGNGIGKSLVQASLQYFYEQGVSSVFIAMQGSNIIAQKLCEHTDFSMYSLRLWYHKWFTACSPDI